MRVKTICASVFLALTTSYANAGVITPGFSFSVASGGGDRTVGTHFHSSTGGDFGNPAGLAEVGDFFTEEVRGLSEYNLAGLVNSVQAFVTFDVFKVGGLFNGTNDFAFDPSVNIDVVAYAGNNTEDISDFQAASIGDVTTFNPDGLVVGDRISFDITPIFNQAINDGLPSLGIRLQVDADPVNNGAWTFGGLELTTDDQTGGQVPEPTALMVWSCLVTCGLLRRRTR